MSREVVQDDYTTGGLPRGEWRNPATRFEVWLAGSSEVAWAEADEEDRDIFASWWCWDKTISMAGWPS